MDSDSSSSSPKELRNWLELPSEVTSLIFTKVGTIDILSRVQYVCSTWRKLCKDPHLFRSIDIYLGNGVGDLSVVGYDMMAELAIEAVNRSCGQLVDFSIEFFVTDELLELIIAKQCPLRRLRFVYCNYNYFSDDVIIETAKKHPLLEELEICNCFFEFREEVIETFGRSCPLLKSFRLNYWHHSHLPIAMFDDLSSETCDEEALAIAQSMPELRHLNLYGAYLTDNGLHAILDGCPHLNSLDLSHCSYLNFAAGLHKKCLDRNIHLMFSDVVSFRKLFDPVHRQILSLLQVIQEADLETVKLEEPKATCSSIDDLLREHTRMQATSSSIDALVSEWTQMQSLYRLFEENLGRMMQEVQGVQEVPALLQDMNYIRSQLSAWVKSQ